MSRKNKISIRHKAFLLGWQIDPLDGYDISWRTLPRRIVSFGLNSERSRDTSLRKLFSEFLNLYFLIWDEGRGTVVKNKFSSSSIVLTSLRRTVDQGSEQFSGNSLVEFESASIARKAGHCD